MGNVVFSIISGLICCQQHPFSSSHLLGGCCWCELLLLASAQLVVWYQEQCTPLTAHLQLLGGFFPVAAHPHCIFSNNSFFVLGVLPNLLKSGT